MYIFVSIELYRVERSSDQVIKPVNLEALSKWVGKIPEDVVRDMADIAPMLSVLGYDPYANPPVIYDSLSFAQYSGMKKQLFFFKLKTKKKIISNLFVKDYGKADSWVKDNTLRVCIEFNFKIENISYFTCNSIVVLKLGKSWGKIVAKSG